ncbi:MAG: SDR family oxidoreductase [Alphaproteobacteria bacterium]|nr:SDR family oxidoreductase [Alphaproteobacteria bacterium]
MSGTAIVTGVSRGIGAACARAFLDAGWRVLGVSRSPCPVPGVVHRAADLLDPGQLDAVGPWLAAQLGPTPARVCLVHNAAMMAKDSAVDLDPAVLRRALALNVVVPAQLNRAVHPLQAPGSSILYIGSTLSEKAVAGTASYVTSKHALAGLMKATCQDLAGTGVHTACVCPGFTATEMLLAHIGADPAVRAAVEAMSTLGRLIEPAEIARLVLFCAENPVINGAMLHANLGQVER